MPQELAYVKPLQLAIAEGATTPNPGAAGVVVWSTSESETMRWNGSTWNKQASSSLAFVAALSQKLWL